jgi:hypothetical protein
MGRQREKTPKPGEPMRISVTVDGALVRRLDEIAAELVPGAKLTRVEVVNHALTDWINSRDRRRGGKKR